MWDGNPRALTASVDSAFETVVIATLAAKGFRRSRRAVTRRDGDLYFSLRLRIRSNLPWGSCIFSMEGGLAVRQCLPFTPRPKKPYDFGQQTIPWQCLNYGFEPEAVTKGQFILRTTSELEEAVGSERDAFSAAILDGFPSIEAVREHLWRVFAAGSGGEFRMAQSARHWRFLAILLAEAGDTFRLEQVQNRAPDLWEQALPSAVQQDWDSLRRTAGLDP